MPETTTSFHIGDRVRIADTNPAWDGWTGTVSPSSAEQRAGDPATLNEHGRLLVALDSGGTQQVLPQGLIPLTYDYAIISGGWSLEQRRHIAEAMAASGLDTAERSPAGEAQELAALLGRADAGGAARTHPRQDDLPLRRSSSRRAADRARCPGRTRLDQGRRAAVGNMLGRRAAKLHSSLEHGRAGCHS